MTIGTEPSGQVDAAEVWRAIGRLESDTATLKKGQRQIRREIRNGLPGARTECKIGLGDLRIGIRDGFIEERDDLQEFRNAIRDGFIEERDDWREFRNEMKAGYQQLNRKLDRLFYVVLAGGGVLLAAILATHFLGG